MSSIVPVPTSRVGDYFVRQRLVGQVQNDQLDLFKLQNQISTGQRMQLPSDDAPAALRAIDLQRLLDRKGQIQTNIQANNNFLNAADSNLSSVSDLMTKLRSDVVGVSGTLSNASDRQTLVQEVDQAIETLVATGNAKFQGRYLFSGSKTQDQPYTYDGGNVQYAGNEGVLRNYVDLDRLFDTNVPGNDVFGGLSDQVQGTSLTPQITADTQLSTINGGNGISKNGAIAISINTGTATKTSVVDLSKATTLGDVARFIEQGAPDGTKITATVTGTGLTLSTSSGSIVVGEVAQGTTASELGILTPKNAAPTSTINSTPLNTTVLKTTQLNDLLGTKAQGVIHSIDANNDILLTATKNGAAFNNVNVIFANDGVAGAETAVYDASDPNNKTLTVHVQAGFSTAKQVVAAINAEGTFSAAVDYHDATAAAQIGTNPVQIANFGPVTSGGSGQSLDTAHGLIISNGGKSATIDTSSLHTVEDLLNAINGTGLGVLAEINSTNDGINIRSRLSGADLTIGENGGQLATQLGIRSMTTASKLADFNQGVGIPTNSDPTKADLLITARDGTQLSVNLTGAKSVQDAIDLINNNVANTGSPKPITARLAQTGNGIELVDASTGTGSLTVSQVEGSQAAEFLGFVPTGQTQVTSSTTDSSGNATLQSADRNAIQPDSVFDTLINLKTALANNDTAGISRSITSLDSDISRVSFARSDIGTRLQSLDVIGTSLQDENVQLKSALSDDMDVDLVQAISDMTARQYSLQASLQTAATMLQLSLLNFI